MVLRTRYRFALNKKIYASRKADIKVFHNAAELSFNIISKRVHNLGIALMACRYRPHTFSRNSIQGVYFYREWINDFGNMVFINRGRKAIWQWKESLVKYHGDAFLTDLHHFMPISTLLKINKRCYVSVCVEETTNTIHKCIVSYGEDESIRGYAWMYDRWERFCPLKFGLDFVMNMMQVPSEFVLDKGFSVLPVEDNIESFYFDGAPGQAQLEKVFAGVDAW
jgi:hypothetical protein